MLCCSRRTYGGCIAIQLFALSCALALLIRDLRAKNRPGLPQKRHENFSTDSSRLQFSDSDFILIAPFKSSCISFNYQLRKNKRRLNICLPTPLTFAPSPELIDSLLTNPILSTCQPITVNLCQCHEYLTFLSTECVIYL